MYVIHCSLKQYGNNVAVYGTDVVSARWTNKARGKWSGRVIRETGDSFELIGGSVHSAEARAKCAAFAREVAARLGMASGPDTFPFA